MCLIEGVWFYETGPGTVQEDQVVIVVYLQAQPVFLLYDSLCLQVVTLIQDVQFRPLIIPEYCCPVKVFVVE